MKVLLIYLAVMNLLAIVITVHDKRAAIRGSWRVKERTLMLTAALGGAPAMYLTMLVIRHKTRKPLFMIGIPVIFLLELSAAFLVARYVFHII